jgi:hypothetical protein
MLDRINEKMCKPDQKFKCNSIHNSPKIYHRTLFGLMTILFRYLLPFIFGAIYFNPIVGMLYILYPFSQIIPYYHIFFEYIPSENLAYTTFDYVYLIVGIVAMIGYYFYVFNQLGSYVFIQIGYSLLLSLIMLYFVDSLFPWGLILLLLSMGSIFIDISLFQTTKVQKK